MAAFAWTGWSWILEFALQWATWFDRLLLTFVPDVLHGLIPVLGVLAFVTQMLLTLIGVWAKQRYTWLVAGDEGLRLHRGWFRTHDVTMRYAVVQQVHLRQGPLQRLFGIGDIEIGSASNSRDDEDEGRRKTRLQNITHPTELRDLVRSRAEATHRGSAPPATEATSAAAVELLQAARGLHLVLAQQDAAERDPAVE